MSKGITKENMMSAFPYALTSDRTKVALASSSAIQLESLCADDDKLTIYTNIDRLDEELLDILAKDYKVDWYLYDGTVESKREQIASSFYVHRHLGTKGALVFALSDLCPGTEVEEWFEYGGRPYYFRVVLDVTEQRLPISQDIAEKIINIVKSARSVLEENSIIYRSRNSVIVACSSGFAHFASRLCGTYPNAAVQGSIKDDNINFGFGGDSAAFNARMCGTPLGSLI